MTRAALVVIGNEILTGKVQDLNTSTLAKRFFDRGVDLVRVEIIPDAISEIASTVSKLSAQMDIVVTSGGIGPTHDDITYEGIAAAFGFPMAFHEETLERMEAHYIKRYTGHDINAARKRMAYFPVPCTTLHVPELWVPIVVVKNVYILPGVPGLFNEMLEGVVAQLTGVKKERVVILTAALEGDIADILSDFQSRFPQVAIGSYPRVMEGRQYVQVTVEGLPGAGVMDVAREMSALISGELLNQFIE